LSESLAPDSEAGTYRAVDDLARAKVAGEHEFIVQALALAGQATYHWTLGSDRIKWSLNAPEVLGVSDASFIKSGRGYASLLDPDNFTSRFEAVMHSPFIDEGEGVAFQIEYLFRPCGRSDPTGLWLEDSGRWIAGPDGRPREVFGVVRQINDRHQRDQHLRFLGNCDPLTGMMNRGRMAEALGETMAASPRESQCCAFLIAAIANLGVVNDAYGFDIADEVIITIGRRIRRVVRTGDAIGRYSGAKFGIILANCDEHELEMAAERFLGVARESVIDTERGPVWAMLSIGGVVLPKFADTPNLAMARAEEALAEARRLPTDGFVPFRPSPERVSARSLNAQCAAEIVTGLKEERFTLAFQPIIDARSGEVAMHEALLRMKSSDGDSITAAHLIPIAEKLGLVRLIDRRVMGLALETLRGFPEARLTLNISGITATDPRWFRQLVQMAAEHEDIVKRLTIEITETAALNDLNEIIRFISELRQFGCSVAVDDFGAGYTSFRNLKVLNVDMVKLDGSFCENLSTNRDNQYFVRSLIDLAKKFDLKTVAEWVQTKEDAILLTSWGIDYLQGDIFGEAVVAPPWKAVGAPVACIVPSADGLATTAEMVEVRREAAEPVADEEPEGLAVQPQPDEQSAEGAATTKDCEDLLLDFSRLRMAISALDAQFRPANTADEEESPGQRERRAG
jgi:diguanylate cyclase (GGDEF)-like protein